ncbi:MAG: hypothetical protein AAB439_01295 [Patescibacteria group bacterium]
MNDIQPTNGQAPQMDPNLAGRVMNLYGRVDEVLNELKVPEDERKQVEQNLMEAIAADLMVRLGAKMNDDQKDRLSELTQNMTVEPNLADVAMFFRDSFKPEDLLQDLGDATESVLDSFIKEMGK